jgi:hypothetical protein
VLAAALDQDRRLPRGLRLLLAERAPLDRVEARALLALDDVLEAARAARRNGADRFCMGAAWREVKDGPEFERVLDMVRGVKALGLETCATLGMLDAASGGASGRGRARLLQPQPRHGP